jgi:DNA-binding cell septation regulator SpoVG
MTAARLFWDNQLRDILSTSDFKEDFIMPATNVKTPPAKAAEAQATAEVGTQMGKTTIAVDVRPIEPRGKLIGFASVTIGTAGGSITIPDFRVFNGDTGLFVSNPSTKDESSGKFRDTARVSGNDLKNLINVTVRDAYVVKVQEMQTRAAAAQGVELKPARIKDQLEKAGAEAAQHNAALPVDRTERTPPPAHDNR